MSEVTYLNEVTKGFSLHKNPVEVGPFPLCLRPGQGEDGYGDAIKTDYEVSIHGKSRRYRVYAICYSNVSSHYINYLRRRVYLRDSDFS
jgi:hypothetical protein